MVLPSFLIIFLISCFLDNFLKISLVHSAFNGIKLAVGILILDAGVTMLKKMKKKAFPVSIMLISAAVMMIVNIFSLHISTIVLMLAAGGVSLLIFAFDEKGWKEK